MQIKSVEFQPPIKGCAVQQFSGWVCIGYSETHCAWHSGCDSDSAADAYNEANAFGERDLLPHTVRMFQVGEK